MNLILNNLDIVFITILIICEILLRSIPTYKNYSIIDFVRNTMLKVHEIIELIVPNIKKDENH
jgi:hypothetical protein